MYKSETVEYGAIHFDKILAKFIKKPSKNPTQRDYKQLEKWTSNQANKFK